LPRDVVEKCAFEAGDMFKKGAYSMIERTAPIFTAETDMHQVKMKMRIEFDRMLNQFCDALESWSKTLPDYRNGALKSAKEKQGA